MRNNLFLLSLLLSLVGCIVPIQSTRVILVENFTQNFTFGENTASRSIIMNSLLGKSFNVFSAPEVLEKWYSNSFIATGNVVLTLSLVPSKKKLEKFFVSGFGAYDIYDEADNKVYFSAKFNIIEKEYLLKDLEKENTISIYFEQIAINQFLDIIIESPNSQKIKREKFALKPIKPIKVEVKIKKLDQDIYVLDYDANHKVSINEKPIGGIKFKSTINSLSKIIDFRKFKPFVRRYKKIVP